MSFRSPYMLSSVGHVVVLTLLVSLTALAPRNLTVPGVHIVSFGSKGTGMKRGAEAASIVKPAALTPEAKSLAPPKPAPPAERPQEKAKKPDKGPQKRDPKLAQAGGARHAAETGMVSKSKGSPAAAAPAAAVPQSPASQGAGSSGGNDRGAVGVEGENGLDSWYLALLHDRIAAVWRAPPTVGRTGEARVVVHIFLRPSGGQPERVEVLQSSQVPFFDRLVQSAVWGAAPYPPYPGDPGVERIGIKLSFSQQY